MYHSFIVVLPELPFPGPTSSKRTDNLLHSPNVADEAREIIHRPDRALVQQLSQALFIAKSTTDQLYVKILIEIHCLFVNGSLKLLNNVVSIW